MFSDNITKFYIDQHTFFDFHHIESTCLWFQSLFLVAFWLLISKVANLHSWCRQLLLGTLEPGATAVLHPHRLLYPRRKLRLARSGAEKIGTTNC